MSKEKEKTSGSSSIGIAIAAVVCALLVVYLLAVGSLACARQVKRRLLVRVFQETAKCLNDAEIPYVVFWGTLLGAHRERSIIPDDDDADFVIFGQDNADKAMALLKERHGSRRFISGERKFFAADAGPFSNIHSDLQVAKQEEGIDGRWVRQDVMSHLGVLPADAPTRREPVHMHGVTVYKPPGTPAVLEELYGSTYMTPIPYKKTEGDPRHNFSLLNFRAAAKRLGLYI